MMRPALWLVVAGLLISWPVRGGVLIPPDAVWKYFPGYYEASTPDTHAWRQSGFDDSGWAQGQAAFYYEDSPGTANAYTGNTLLGDMRNLYTCVFLRRAFVVNNPADVAALQVSGFSDDGFIAWINGQEVARFNMPAGDIPFNGLASGSLPEPLPWWTNTLTGVQSLLVPGTDVLAVQAFNNSLSGSSDFIINPAVYYVQDTTAPTVSLAYPAAGATVRKLVAVEVGFSKPVTGVDAADLRVNGQPATNLTVVTPSQFVFQFAPPAAGTVQVTWAPGHGIRDLTTAGNAFAGAGWSYTVNPAAPLQDVIISEFMASNSGDQTNSVHDELGGNPDWIEIYNGTGSLVDLTGWSLTDEATKPAKWRFPATVLPARAYLLVMASGRDTNVNGQLHTSFKLNASAGYLGLIDPAGNVISAFSPVYPPQYPDISYGRDRLDPLQVGYFTNATPLAANATRGPGFGPEVRFSRASGTFTADFTLALSTADSDCDIRYVFLTTNAVYGTAAQTNVPTATSPLYTGPITVANTAQVRARAFPRQAGLWPGPPCTESYIRLGAAAAAFTSDLPILLLHNLGGGLLSSAVTPVNQSVILMVFEPVDGRASMTNPPTLASRAGWNIRGSSTAGNPQYNLALELWDEYNSDRKAELLGMPEESDWVLYAQDGFDVSFLHNPLAHQLSRDIGRYSSRTRFAEAFVNTVGGVVNLVGSAGGHYFGLYTVEEKIKRGSGRVDIEKLEPQVVAAPGLTGGYLLKIDRADANERTFYDANSQQSIIYVEPPGLEMVTAARQAQAAYISNYFRQFGNALWGASYTDPVAGYAAWIDVSSWIDHHILNAATYNVDAFRLSGYFYKDRNQKIEMGPLWDFDRSQGTYNPSGGAGDARCFNPRLWRVQATGDQGTDFFGNPALLGVRWWQRLFTDYDFWQLWIDRWAELRSGSLSTAHINQLIDSFAVQISQAYARHVVRWTSTRARSGTLSANGYAYAFNGAYSGEIAFLKKWWADRVSFIDTNFLRAPVFSSPGGLVAPGFTVTVTAPTLEPDTTIYYTLDGTDPRAPGGWLSPSAYSASSPLTVPIYANTRLCARNWNSAHYNLIGGAIGGNPPISSPWSAPVAATFVLYTPRLAITELMYHPAEPASGPYTANDFEFIELKNTGAEGLYLPGIRFTNGIHFTFATTNDITVLQPGEYVVLVRNRAAFLSRYPTVANIGGEFSGQLDNAGERIYLEGALREPILDFSYSDAWYPATDGAGFSLVIRNESGAFNTWTNPLSWRVSRAIGGSPGVADPAPLAIPPVVINEVLTHTDPPQVDTIELYNPTGSPAPIGGWFLTDDASDPMKFPIPGGTTIGAFGFQLFNENQFNTGSNTFALSSFGEEVYLFSGDGANLTGYRHGFKFGAQVNGVTFGRYITSDGKEHLVTQVSPTLGWGNSGPKVGPVVINEILYSPRPFGLSPNHIEEFIELRNTGSAPAPLYDPTHATNAWRFDGAVSYLFPAGVVMPPFSQLLVVSFDPVYDPVSLAWFRTRYVIDPATPIYGPFEGKLANTGDHVALFQPDKPELPSSPIAGYVPQVLVEEVNYSNQAPWPTSADGTGNSIARVNTSTFADDPTNWVAAVPSPGRPNPASVSYDTDHDGLPNDWELAYGLDPNDASGGNGAAGDPDGDGMTNLQEYLAGTSPVDGADFLRFEMISLTPDQCGLQFTARPGRVYSIERNTLAPGTAWTVAASNLTGSGPVTFYDQRVSTSRFYRLRASVAP